MERVIRARKIGTITGERGIDAMRIPPQPNTTRKENVKRTGQKIPERARRIFESDENGGDAIRLRTRWAG